MQFGTPAPSPPNGGDPHALAPRMLPSQPIASSAYVDVPVSASYSLAITDTPSPCVVVSHAAHVNPNPNRAGAAVSRAANVDPHPDGSVAAWATAPSSCFFTSANSCARVTSRPAGSPAA